jgi:hypothetical protein
MRHLSLSNIATVNACIILIAILIVSPYTIRPTTLAIAQLQTIVQRDLTIELVVLTAATSWRAIFAPFLCSFDYYYSSLL